MWEFEKFLSLVAILAISLIGALLPVVSPKVSHFVQAYERELRMFSGGVFLAVALLDLEPEGIEALRAFSGSLPLAQFILGGSFVTLLVLDRLVSSRLGNNQDRHASSSLTIGLILNALFDGVALGTQNSKKSVWSLCLGISAHKSLEVFMFSTGLGEAVKVKYSLLFCAITPVGALAGLFASAQVSAPNALVVMGAINAALAGAFLFITLIGVVVQDFLVEAVSFKSVVAFAIGYFFLAVVTATLLGEQEEKKQLDVRRVRPEIWVRRGRTTAGLVVGTGGLAHQRGGDTVSNRFSELNGAGVDTLFVEDFLDLLDDISLRH